MSNKAYFTSQDPEFFEEIWQEFLDYVEANSNNQEGLVKAIWMALNEPADSGFRDQAFFKMGCAW